MDFNGEADIIFDIAMRIAWQDSEEKLKTEFEAASDTKIRMRLQQLWLIRQGYRIPEAS